MEPCKHDNLWLSKKGLSGESLVAENFNNSVQKPLTVVQIWAPGK